MKWEIPHFGLLELLMKYLSLQCLCDCIFWTSNVSLKPLSLYALSLSPSSLTLFSPCCEHFSGFLAFPKAWEPKASSLFSTREDWRVVPFCSAQQLTFSEMLTLCCCWARSAEQLKYVCQELEEQVAQHGHFCPSVIVFSSYLRPPTCDSPRNSPWSTGWEQQQSIIEKSGSSFLWEGAWIHWPEWVNKDL